MVEVLTAIALVIVLEGVLPALSPSSYRRAAAQLGSLSDKAIRNFGLCLMLFGAALLYLVR